MFARIIEAVYAAYTAIKYPLHKHSTAEAPHTLVESAERRLIWLMTPPAEDEDVAPIPAYAFARILTDDDTPIQDDRD